jgi:hypothetical protein
MIVSTHFDVVKVRRERLSVQVGTKKKRKKGGEEIEIPVYEEWWNHTTSGYKTNALRKIMRMAARRVAFGSRKTMKEGVELVLQRFPQVNTVMGELKHAFKGVKLVGAYTTKEEGNLLYVIKAA